ncbi:MAG: SDR family oxidoreductase [Gemmatimonadales bacterium]|nr:MAG: SDR family oxidoreductase [Gemmatimonadales bacterium]
MTSRTETPSSSGAPSPGRALVTGASSGIGDAIARELASRGWDLVLTARSEERLHRLADELRERHGVGVHVISEDLSDTEAPARLEARTEGAGLPVDLLVNNAGFGRIGPLLAQEAEDANAMIAVNVTAVTELLRRFAPHMVARGGGRILNVASTAAFQPGPLMAVYYATKAYVVSFSEAVRNELASSGVTVTTLCPGVTGSEFHERAGMHGDSVLERLRPASAEEVARFGVEAALLGKGVVIPGRLNRILATAVRFVPRSIVPAIVRRIQEGRG